MNSFLLNRQLGSVSQQAFASAQNNRLLSSLQAAPDVKFSLQSSEGSNTTAANGQHGSNIANSSRDGAKTAKSNSPHPSGVNSIAIDRFEGRYLLSAGADSSVAIWDLESNPPTPGNDTLYTPLGHTPRTSTTESLGITHASFYPFDSLAFLTSGYDRTLKLFDSETLAPSASFDLDHIVYSHATSTCASHLLVACGTQHPAVRLVDLRSGSASHSLAGHSGSVLSVAWHPKEENILVSGATDGGVRVWDIRRSASSLGVLDMEDSVGVAGYDGRGTGARRRERGRAHNGAVNGLAWTGDGAFLVSAGQDERMRVWDVRTGANTLANFGPGLKNAQKAALVPLLAPSFLSLAGKETVFFPNPKEVMAFDLHSGALVSRLRLQTPGLVGATQTLDPGTSRNLTPRTTSLAWRAHHVELYSAHADGAIRCWRPRTWEDIAVEKEEKEDSGEGVDEVERKRKREELEGIVRELTTKRVTYS